MTRHLSRRGALAGLAALACAMAGAVKAATATHVVAITKMKFAPPAGPLAVGDQIVWRNQDIFRHTATARDGSFDLDLPPGEEATLTLAAAGQIEVFCRFHPGMTLVLSVTGA